MIEVIDEKVEQEVINPEQEVINPEQETVEEVKTEPTTVKEEETSEGASIDDIVSGTKKVKTGIQSRINELTKEKYELKREVEHWKEQATRKAEPSISAQGGRPVMPVENDFVDMEDYRKARTQYEDSLDTWKSSQRQNAEFQEKQKQDREANLVSFNENAKRMREKYLDFDVVVNEPVFTPVMGDEITASEYGPEIGYYLAKNPAEALRLSKLTPNKIAKEIGKLEVKFSQAVKRTSTNAPTPLTPIKGDDAPARDTSKMTGDEWYKWDMQQKLKKFNKEK